jgi:rhodanese-related sulfurtransferase
VEKQTVWIPLSEFKERLDTLDRSREMTVRLESGLRSYKGCLRLEHGGFRNVKNVDGGMLCWCYDPESDGEKGADGEHI